MPLSLPKPIAAYFTADKHDGLAIAQCFSANAIVVDEQKIYAGRDAIAAWKSAASAKYDYVAEPIASEGDGDVVRVTAQLTGRFPGSPVQLRYAFTLSGDAITRLEIGA